MVDNDSTTDSKPKCDHADDGHEEHQDLGRKSVTVEESLLCLEKVLHTNIQTFQDQFVGF